MEWTSEKGGNSTNLAKDKKKERRKKEKTFLELAKGFWRVNYKKKEINFHEIFRSHYRTKWIVYYVKRPVIIHQIDFFPHRTINVN